MARKQFAAIAATVGLAFAATQANATVFAGSWELTYQNADPGLVLGVYDMSSSSFNVDLAAQDPDSVNLFKIYTNEGWINEDDEAASPISLKFIFDLPNNNSGPVVVGGTTQGVAEFFGYYQAGVLTWANGGQAQLTWGHGEPGLITPGLMTLTVNGGAFNEGYFWTGTNEGKRHGLKVAATFDWDNDPTFGAVPEPATWALMIGGFGLAGAMIRRRRELALA